MRADWLLWRGVYITEQPTATLGNDLHENAMVQQISDRARVRAAGFGREKTICEYERLITGLITCRDPKDRLADQT